MVTSFAEWELDETGYLQCDYPLRTSRCLQMENIGDYSDSLKFQLELEYLYASCYMLRSTQCESCPTQPLVMMDTRSSAALHAAGYYPWLPNPNDWTNASF